MIVAFVIGIAFGFALERAGLGSARKLIGQFYLTDFTVFKVMFTAILVAMLGAFWLSRLGILELSRVYVPETWLLPQLVGGAIFGIGFVVAGLCPGTSCVAAATGRGDGAMVVAGMFSGVLITGLAFAPLRDFYESTGRGALTLPSLLHVPYGVVVCAIVFLALGGFMVAERIESKPETRNQKPEWRRSLGLVALVAGLFAAAPANPQPPTANFELLAAQVAREEDHVTALELAAWIKDRKPGLRVLDLRTPAEFKAARIPGAERLALESIAKTPFRSDETLVLISDGGAHAAQAWVFLRALGHRHVYFLRGGMGEWNDEVLNAKASTPVTRYFRRGGC